MASVPQKVQKLRCYCSVFGCMENSYKNPKLIFFCLPKRLEKRNEWLRLISREDLIGKDSTHRICNKHFNEHDIMKSEIGQNRLKKDILPSLNLPKCPSTSSRQIQVSDSSTQTPNDQIMSGSDIMDSLSAVETEQTDLSRDMFHKLCDRLLSKDLAVLVKAQTYLRSRCNRNSSLEYKMFCLNLFYVSPQAYRLLEKTICLPDKGTLFKPFIPNSTQTNDNLMEALKVKVNNMSDAEKHCTLVVTEMSLKTNLYYDIKQDKIIGFHEVDGIQSPSPAKYALLVIIQGIFVKWWQPIGFALISQCKKNNNISKWIDKLTSKLFDIGLKVRAFVSHPESDLLNAAKKRDISTEKTHFTINGHKIYYIFDAPQLTKSVRDHLLTYDFYFGNNAVVKFDHIIKFYEYDKKRTFKLAHNLTDSHINPSNSEKMDVRYASQILSRSVAAGMSTCIDIKILDESAIHTVELVKMINDLFDTLNSSVFRHSYSYKKAFSGDENQVDFLNNMLVFFQTLKLINPKTGQDDTESVKFIQRFQITIKSILRLYEDLKQEGYKHLLTRQLNQDITENFFRKIRSNNDKTDEPTSRQFISAFRKIYFDNFNQPPKTGNCAENLSKFFVILNDFETTFNDNRDFNINSSSIDEQGNNLREIVRSDYTEFGIPENNVFFYVCGILMRKVINRHKDCELFKSYMNGLDVHDPVCNSVQSNKNYGIDRNLLPNDFVKYIGKLEQVFREAFQNQYLNGKIGLSIYQEMEKIEWMLPCPCFPKQYLLKFYIRMRMYQTLKFNNQAFRTSRNRRKYFSVQIL